MPRGYGNVGNGNYANDLTGIEIDVFKDNATDFVKNDSSVKYTLVPGKIKNGFNYTYKNNNQTRIVEIIEPIRLVEAEEFLHNKVK